jgi:hypothetical protein
VQTPMLVYTKLVEVTHPFVCFSEVTHPFVCFRLCLTVCESVLSINCWSFVHLCSPSPVIRARTQTGPHLLVLQPAKIPAILKSRRSLFLFSRRAEKLSGAGSRTPRARMEKRRMEYRYVDKQQTALLFLSGTLSYAYTDTEAWTAELFFYAAGFRERYFVVEPKDSLCQYFEVPPMCSHATLSRAVIFAVANL